MIRAFMLFSILGLVSLGSYVEGAFRVVNDRPFSFYYPYQYQYYYPRRQYHYYNQYQYDYYPRQQQHYNGNCYWLYTNGSYVYYCD